MSYALPDLAVTGQVIAAAWGNQNRDNWAESAVAKFTSAGDLFVGTGANAGKRLGKGTALQGLRVNAGGTDLEWATLALALTDLPRIYACEVYHSVDQAVGSLGSVALAWDSEHLDPQTMHDPSTNNSRITFPVAGIAFVLATVIWDATNTADHRLELTWNAGSGTSGSAGNTPTAGQRFTQHAFQIRQVAAADYVQCVAKNDGGDSDNVVGAAGVNNFYSKFAAFLIPGQV